MTSPIMRGTRERGIGDLLTAQASSKPSSTKTRRPQKVGAVILYHGIDQKTLDLYKKVNLYGHARTHRITNNSQLKQVLGTEYQGKSIGTLVMIFHSNLIMAGMGKDLYVPLAGKPTFEVPTVDIGVLDGCNAGRSTKLLRKFADNHRMSRISAWNKYHFMGYVPLVSGKQVTIKKNQTLPFNQAVSIYRPFVHRTQGTDFESVVNGKKEKDLFFLEWLLEKYDTRWPHEVSMSERSKYLVRSESFRVRA